MAGRKTLFNEAIAAEIIKALQIGMLMQDAAEFAGITKQTLYDWIKKGKYKPAEHPLHQFSDSVSKAKSSAKFRAVGRVAAGMAKDWKAAAWWLRVTDPKNYGEKVRVTLEEEFNGAIARIKKRVDPAVFEQVLDAIIADDSDDVEIGDSSLQ